MSALVGRDADVDALRSALKGVHTSGLALLIRGEAGIGKSALLEVASADASGQNMVVMGTTGVQSEGDLPFACLHQLLRPLLGHVDDLPQAQRRRSRPRSALPRAPRLNCSSSRWPRCSCSPTPQAGSRWP